MSDIPPILERRTSDDDPSENAFPASLAGFLGLAVGVVLGLAGSMLLDSTVAELAEAKAANQACIETIVKRDTEIAEASQQATKAAAVKKQELAALHLEHEDQREKQYAKSDDALEKALVRAFAAEDALRAAKQRNATLENRNSPAKETVAPKKAPAPDLFGDAPPSTNERSTKPTPFEGIERVFSKSPHWVLGGLLSKDGSVRTYTHGMGDVISFWVIEGKGRIEYQYEPKKKNLAGVVWLMLQQLGGTDDATYKENSGRISEWLGDPTPFCSLVGGHLKATVKNDLAIISVTVDRKNTLAE